jgi:hypothetical protein
MYGWYDEDPGEGWSRVSDFTYYSGVENGWVALDPFSANCTGHSSYGAASNTIRSSVEAWKTVRFLSGAIDSVNPLYGALRDAKYKFFGTASVVDPASTPYVGGFWSGTILQSAAGVVAGAAAPTSGAAASLDEIALAEANAAQAAGKTSGAATALETTSGRVFTGVSGGQPTANPRIIQAGSRWMTFRGLQEDARRFAA